MSHSATDFLGGLFGATEPQGGTAPEPRAADPAPAEPPPDFEPEAPAVAADCKTFTVNNPHGPQAVAVAAEPETITATVSATGLLLQCERPDTAVRLRASKAHLERVLSDLARQGDDDPEPQATDAPPGDPWLADSAEPDWACPTCGGLLWWDDLLGGRHCMTCEADKLQRSLDLAERAKWLRSRHPVENPKPRKRACCNPVSEADT